MRFRRLATRVLSILAGVALLRLAGGAPLRIVDNFVYDLVLQVKAAGAPPAPEIVLIEVDDASVEALGRFPWSRTRFAELLERLTAAKPRAVVLDFLFSSKTDPAADASLERALKRSGRAVLSVVGRGILRADGRVEEDARAPGLSRLRLYAIEDPIRPIASLAKAAAGLGQASVVDDRDGAIRRFPMYFAQDGRGFPALSVAGLAAGGVSVSARDFPVRPDSTLGVNFALARPDSFARWSFVEVLDADKARIAKAFKDKWVFVMAHHTAGTDYLRTPLSWMMPGGQIHAYALLTLLRGEPIRRPGRWAPYALAVLLAGLLALANLGDRPLRWLAAAAAGIGGPAVGAAAGLFWGGFYLEPALACHTAAGTLLVLAFRRWTESSEKAGFLRRSFNRYFGRGVGARILRAKGAVSAERRELTILFTDLADFTSFSDEAEAGQVEEVLRLFNDAAISAVEESHGTVDKLIGDAVMAYWNYPSPVEDHAARAVQAALALKRRMAAVNEELARRRLPAFLVHTGIATGPVTVGEFGNARFASHTAIGRAVNLAQRLQAFARPGEILISRATRRQADGKAACVFTDRDPVTLRGFHKPVFPYGVEASSEVRS